MIIKLIKSHTEKEERQETTHAMERERDKDIMHTREGETRAASESPAGWGTRCKTSGNDTGSQRSRIEPDVATVDKILLLY